MNTATAYAIRAHAIDAIDSWNAGESSATAADWRKLAADLRLGASTLGSRAAVAMRKNAALCDRFAEAA